MEDTGLTRNEARQIAEEAVTVVFERMGVDPSEWREAQKDFAFLRAQRLGSEAVGTWVKRSAVLAFVSGALWLIGEGIKHFLSTHTPQ